MKLSYLSELWGALLILNLEALRHRYGYEELLESAEWVDLEAEPDELSGTALFGALDFFLYQCSEGKVQENVLFMALTAICEQLPGYIVRDSFEYRNSAWR